MRDLIMRFRRTIPIVMLAGAIGGALNGAFQTKMTAFAFHSVLSIPVFTPVLQYAIGIGTGFGLALLLTLMFGFENKPVQAEDKKKPVATAASLATN